VQIQNHKTTADVFLNVDEAFAVSGNPTIKIMKIKFVLASALLLLNVFAAAQANTKPAVKQSVKKAAKQSNQSVKKLGVFTNMRFTAEHQYGYSVELWQEKNRVFGLFLSSEGLIGDTPTGLLEDAALDSKTGRLTFRARLSMGMTFDKNNKEVPTRDVFQFEGVLKNRHLIGTLTHTDDSTGPATNSKKKISLVLSKSETAAMNPAQSYDEWKKAADEILALRGPKW
jgi:hypothetical protein